MSFESLGDFVAMGGHGLYVWLCYGAGLVAFVALVLAPRFDHARIVRELNQQQRRKQIDKRAQSAQKVAFGESGKQPAMSATHNNTDEMKTTKVASSDEPKT